MIWRNGYSDIKVKDVVCEKTDFMVRLVPTFRRDSLTIGGAMGFVRGDPIFRFVHGVGLSCPGPK